MKQLSILIPTLPERGHYLDALLSWLMILPDDPLVEVLVNDHPKMPTGAKRNDLVRRASGKYCVHVDDDDLTTPYFATELLLWMEHLDVDAYGYFVQFYEDGVAKEIGQYSRHNQEYRCTVDPNARPYYLRPISHICPVRTSIARAVLFPNTSVCEDVAWSMQVKQLIRSEKFIPLVMYHYFFRNDKTKIETAEAIRAREEHAWDDKIPAWVDEKVYQRETDRLMGVGDAVA